MVTWMYWSTTLTLCFRLSLSLFALKLLVLHLYKCFLMSVFVFPVTNALILLCRCWSWIYVCFDILLFRYSDIIFINLYQSVLISYCGRLFWETLILRTFLSMQGWILTSECYSYTTLCQLLLINPSCGNNILVSLSFQSSELGVLSFCPFPIFLVSDLPDCFFSICVLVLRLSMLLNVY